MKRNKNNIVSSILVLSVAAIYFLVATSHIFLLKNRTRADQNPRVHSNIITNKKIGVFYSKVDDVSFIKLLDKITAEEKKNVNDLIQFTAVFFVTTLFILAIWQLKPQSFNIRRSGPVLSYQEYYLSLCTLRI
jgi:hypothetical protein